ncbi:MAG: Cys-tRNA(Pro) deacylase [Actinomycetota bacterium]|nr:Cys-tRNA(Pro) deacylase [Actinomycetota bacterium]
MSGKVTPAVTAARRAKIDFRVHERDTGDLDDELGYGPAAAVALDVDPARVHKTLVVRIGEQLAVAVVPVHRDADLKAVAAALGTKKATMAERADAERSTGYVIGGISPLGQRKRLPTVVDEDALAHDTVFISGGRRGLEIELTASDLIALCRAAVAPIATG